MTAEELAVYNSGKKVYRKTDKLKQEKVHQMDLVDDAMELVRDKSNAKEVAYANYANTLKQLANDARKEARSIKPTPVNKQAQKTYANEVSSLTTKINKAKMNAPKERLAQSIANAEVSEIFKSNPDMDYEHRQREQSRAITKARAQVGASKEKIQITDSEWDAIQSHAISTQKVIDIINNTDQDAFKKRAMPRNTTNTLTASQIAMAKSMYSSGMYTQAEIASILGVSASTVSNAVRKSA
jgi:predicted DNA binding protein